MKTQTQQMDGREIDFEKAEKYLQGIMPNLERDFANEFTFLETVEPIVCLDRYPSRVSVQFLPKGKKEEERIALFQSLPEYKKELKKFLERVSSIISTIANRHDLEARSGIIMTEYDNGKKIKFYSHELGEYTIRPFYNKFRVND